MWWNDNTNNNKWFCYSCRTVQTSGTGENTASWPDRDVHPTGESQLVQTGTERGQTEGNLQTHCGHKSTAYESVLQSGK